MLELHCWNRRGGPRSFLFVELRSMPCGHLLGQWSVAVLALFRRDVLLCCCCDVLHPVRYRQLFKQRGVVLLQLPGGVLPGWVDVFHVFGGVVFKCRRSVMLELPCRFLPAKQRRLGMPCLHIGILSVFGWRLVLHLLRQLPGGEVFWRGFECVHFL